MALKSSREGLRKELVDYLGNIIIDENLKQNIINSIDDVFAKREDLSSSVNILEEEINNESLSRENADNALRNSINLETTARQEAINNIENMINNGVLKFDLLWTNANPKSEFAQQTISVNLSTYDLILIDFFRDSISDLTSQILIPSESQYSSITMYSWPLATILYREFHIADNSISFSDGARMINFGTDTHDNYKMIPYKIYGVK